MPRRCAVLGQPIAHSLSPVLHRAAYAELGLDWSYDAIEVGSPDLAGFLGTLAADWRGLSLTMPLKRTVIPLLSSQDDWTRLSGVANTVVIDDGALRGYNTDIPGAVDALRRHLGGPVARVVVLGGGATAVSVLLAAAELGCESATLLVRDPSRAVETLDVVGRHPRAPQLDVQTLDGPPVRADLVISTVPATAQTPELLARVAAVPAVFEVVYYPWPTPLAAAARASGRVLVPGLDMLVGQAALQVSLMTGRDDIPVAAMRAAGEQALAERSRP
ncbi:MAG: shikimate dehydrogenase [Marmoricola sp.]|jgi:shikimate dehydrogenase|nr:shikimate dehydrogenase [Marmoricola sp.]